MNLKITSVPSAVFCAFFFLSQTYGNSYAVGPFLESQIPKIESVKSIETAPPATGLFIQISLDELKKFISQGKRIFVGTFSQIQEVEPKIMDRLSQELHNGPSSMPKGIFVDANFKVYRWTLYSPSLLQISDFGGSRTVFLYLEKPIASTNPD